MGEDAAQAMQRAGFESAPVAQIVVDTDHRLAAANLQARMLFDLGPADIGAPVHALELASRPVELRSRIEQVSRVRHAVALHDVEWRTATGTRIVDVEVTPLLDPGGGLDAVSVTFVDVTRYRWLQDALHDSKRDLATRTSELQAAVEELDESRQTVSVPGFLDRALRRFPGGVIAFDRELRIVEMNQPARRLLGWRDTDVGAPLPEGPLRLIAERMRISRSPRRPIEVPHGALELRVAGVPGSDTEPALLLLDNVTSERLRERVSREFLRNASHQLRTPVAAIGAAVDALAAGAKDDATERERFLGHIAEHAARMARLTRSLLVLARAQSGEQAIRLDFVTLAPVVERIAAQVHPVPGVIVETSCEPGIAAFGDADLLEETLAALLENAVAHTREGHVRVTATTHEWSARIEVEDTGAGILPEHRARVFEPFYQPAPGGGFGLGLAIAKQAVDAMDGRIEIATTEGGGTTIRVHLPSARVIA